MNKGDGVDFFNIGRFDHPGDDYAGPDGISGVDWLDGSNICFAVGGETNQCPVELNFPPNNTITLTEDNLSLQLTVSFIGPEAGQIVSTVVDSGGLANFTATSTDGNPSTVENIGNYRWRADFAVSPLWDGCGFDLALSPADTWHRPCVSNSSLIQRIEPELELC